MIKAIIGDEYSEWEETFDVSDIEEIKKIIKNFNNTLRKNETPRYLVSFAIQNFDIMSNEELLKNFVILKNKQLLKIRRKTFDQVAGDYAKDIYTYLIKKKRFNDMLNALPNGYSLLLEDFRDVLYECVKRFKNSYINEILKKEGGKYEK